MDKLIDGCPLLDLEVESPISLCSRQESVSCATPGRHQLLIYGTHIGVLLF